MHTDDFFRLVRSWLTVYLPRSRRLSAHTIRSYNPSSAVGGHSGGSERASMLVNAIRWFRNG